MARTASYTAPIQLTAAAPVTRPKRASAPDLSGWVEKLREVDQLTRQAGRSDLAIPFPVPAEAAKTAKLRFQQASAQLGVGVSIVVEKVNPQVSRVLVTTMKRRERASKGATNGATGSGGTSAPVAAPKPPTGLPKPAPKR